MEQKDKVIEALSLRYDSEYSKFDDRVKEAVDEKIRDIQELSEMLEQQK